MDFEEKLKFVNDRLHTLMAYQEISSLDYVAISKKLMRAEDDIDLSNVMTDMGAAVIQEQTRKIKEKRERDEERRRKRG